MLDWQQLNAAYYLPLALACGWWRWRGACATRDTQPASLYLSLSLSLSRISLICTLSFVSARHAAAFVISSSFASRIDNARMSG